MAVTVGFLVGMVGEGGASEHAQIEKFMYKPSSFRLLFRSFFLVSFLLIFYILIN
jgi:hypothetical protein